jgi:hypothetical protein
MENGGHSKKTVAGEVSFCPENHRLLNLFGEAVQELVRLNEQQFIAIVNGDPDSSRFDLLIHMATEKKQQAKYDYLQHVETHGC